MKIKKIISAVICAAMCMTMFTTNVFAADNQSHPELIIGNVDSNSVYAIDSNAVIEDLSALDFVYGDLNGIATYSTNTSYHIEIAENWIDTMRVSWREGNTTAYHTLTCGVGDVYYSGWAQVSSYTNHNGTYYNVYVLGVAPQTLFSCWEVYSSPSTGYNRWTTDCFGLETPRRLTEEQIAVLHSEGDPCYIIYDANSNTVIDLWSKYLNPMIFAEWSTPSVVQ